MIFTEDDLKRGARFILKKDFGYWRAGEEITIDEPPDYHICDPHDPHTGPMVWVSGWVEDMGESTKYVDYKVAAVLEAINQ